MTVYPKRATGAYIDQSTLDAVGRFVSFARRALRARAAFFWSSLCEPAALIACDGDVGGIDADALAASFAARVLSAPGPVALAASCTLGGVAVRAADVASGVLFVADSAPRAFSADDLALIREVGENLRCELALAPAYGPIPVDALVRMSDARVGDAGMPAAIAPADDPAAADRLASVATRRRKLAAAGTRTARIEPLPAGDAPAFQGGGATILLADDLDLNRKLISDMLTVEGHRVDCVADGTAAVAAVKARAYDLVLMDVIMPVMDGIAATRAIRALPAPACNIPIVALTANTFREQLASCLEAGMDATLTKPMTFEMLINAVADWTRGRIAAA